MIRSQRAQCRYLAMVFLAGIVLGGCGRQPKDYIQLTLEFHDGKNNPVRDVTAHVYDIHHKELAKFAPPRGELPHIDRRQGSYAQWVAGEYIKPIENGIVVIVKRNDKTLKSFELTLADFKGGYQWPTLWRPPSRSSWGCLFCGGWYYYELSMSVAVEQL